MRLTASIAVLLLCAIFIAADTEEANAMAQTKSIFGEPASIFDEINTIKAAPQEANQEATAQEVAAVSEGSEATQKTNDQDNDDKDKKKDQAKAKKKKKTVKYKVQSGDTLTKIAKKHKTSWKRLFFKNKRIENPDLISVGDVVIIPRQNEKLKKRAVPKPAPQAAPATQAETTAAPQQQATAQAAAAPAPAPAAPQPQPAAQTATRGSSAGNTYYAGYCTWYAKNRRPDLPNNLGNAYTWVSRAAAQGIPTGSTPRVGAIGQQGNHVVYVESVNGNGTVTVSEMNFTGWNQTSQRTVPASSFHYIY